MAILLTNLENKREKFFNIIKSIKDLIFQSKDIKNIISLAEFFGILNVQNFAGIYFDDEIENYIFEIIKKKINNRNFYNKNSNTITFLATELYEYGGHTLALLSWIKFSKNFKNKKLIITKAIPANVENILKISGVYIYKCKYHYLEKIKEIINEALGSKYIVLFTHPHDIISIMAAKFLSELGHMILFYNHADHTFSYGITSSDIVCEISEFGFELNKNKNRKGKKHIYLGIPVPTEKEIDVDVLIKKYNSIKDKKEKIILSCGSFWKYEPYNDISFDSFIDKLLSNRKERDIRFVIVGSTGKEGFWRNVKAKWKKYVTFFGFLPYNNHRKLLDKADIYIDSFPVPGGTAFPEALLRGIPCLGLKTYLRGYHCAENLHFKDINTLVDKVCLLLKGEQNLLDLIVEAFLKTKEINSELAFKDRLEKLYSNQIKTYIHPCSKSNGRIDTSWFEKFWEANKNIFIPPLNIIDDLTPTLKFKLIKTLGFSFEDNRYFYRFINLLLKGP